MQVSNRGAIEKALEEVISANPAPWLEFKAGNQRRKGYLIGQVMKQGQGKFNPKIVNDVIDETLSTP
jgi:aspartyl-tRNA(Asn)/glutamyl-tRNA(Gln) amidotransferase subunit B